MTTKAAQNLRAAQNIPEDVRASILDRYARGQSIQTISFALDRAHGTISAVLKEAGVTRVSTLTWQAQNANLRRKGPKPSERVVVPFRKS